MRNLNRNARAITSLRVASTGAAMGQVDQDLNPLTHDVVRFLTLDVDYKANSTGIAFIGWIV